jgi:hypothetical protein
MALQTFHALHTDSPSVLSAPEFAGWSVSRHSVRLHSVIYIADAFRMSGLAKVLIGLGEDRWGEIQVIASHSPRARG